MGPVIFACVHAAGRSQIAAAFFNRLAASAQVHALAAGTQPTSSIYPEVLQVMLEVGVDLRNHKPQLLTAEMLRDASLLVTMGCAEQCPGVAHAARENWFLDDPAGKSVDEVRRIRDDIRRLVQNLIARDGWVSTAP